MYISCPEDFIGQLHDSQKSIKGFGGTWTKDVKIGTLLWRWMDDNEKEFKFHIPNSYYVPSGGVRLLSPQHWAKTQQGSKKDGYHGILSQTTSRDITLMWNNRQNRLTVPLSKENNVGTFHLAPGYTKYDKFRCMMTTEDGDHPIISMEAPMTTKKLNTPLKGLWKGKKEENQNFTNEDQSIETDLELNENNVLIYNNENLDKKIELNTDEHTNISDNANGLLKIHQRFGHISVAKFQIMAKR